MFLELISGCWFELSAMFALMLSSGFFSCSEAAFFSLTRSQRSAMAIGNSAEQRAVAMLARPERLLTTILFWNLLINMTYFALASVVTLRLQEGPLSEGWGPQAFAIASLMAMIFTSELIPKNLGVLRPRLLSAIVALPLSMATSVLDRVLPLLQTIGNATSRLIVPEARPESAFALEDLERAVEVGSGETHDDKQLLVRERQVLQRVVDLANASVTELMQPRRRCTVLAPPGKLEDLAGEVEGEYLLFTEPGSEEIAAALQTNRLAFASPKNLALQAVPVVYVPWCATASQTLGRLRNEGSRVAAVVNELGETTGVITIERLLDAVLRDSSREDPTDAHAIRLRLSAGAWEATGATPLRKIAKRLQRKSRGRKKKVSRLQREFDAMRSVTVSGLLFELLDRPACLGDSVMFAGWEWTVIEGGGEQGKEARGDMPLVVRIAPMMNPSESKGGSQ